MEKASVFGASLLLGLLMLSQLAFGQSDLLIVGSCGDRLVGSTMVLDWTVGEPIVATLTTSSRLLSQGFHQPSVDTLVIAGIQGTTAGLAAVAPNPSAGLIMLQITDWPNAHLQVQVSDGTGTILQRLAGVGPGNTPINLTQYTAGLYQISVYDPAKNSTQLFRILKCN